MNDYARNLDTHGDGEDGPEIQAHYKALAGLERIIRHIDLRIVDVDEDDLMEIVEFVFANFDDPTDRPGYDEGYREGYKHGRALPRIELPGTGSANG